MSSNPPDLNGLLQSMLQQQSQTQQQAQTQQQQTQQQLQPHAAFASSAQANVLPPPAPTQAAGTTPSLSQLMDYLIASSKKPAPAPKPKPEDIHAQLQRYLGIEQSNDVKENEVAAAPAPAVQPPASTQTSWAASKEPQNGFSPSQFQTQQQLMQQQFSQPVPQLPVPHHIEQNMEAQRIQDNLFQNIQFLEQINPGLLNLALMQAFDMKSPVQGQGQQQQQQQQQLQIQQQQQLQQLQAQQAILPQAGQLALEAYQTGNQLGLSTSSPFIMNQSRQNHPDSSSKTFDPTSAAQGMSFVAPQMETANLPSPKLDLKEPKSTGIVAQDKEKSQAPQPPALENNQEEKYPQNNKDDDVKVVKPAKKKILTAAKQQKKQEFESDHNPSRKEPSKPPPHMASAKAALPPLPLPIHTPDESVLQTWPLEKLEMHVQQLKLAQQPIPKYAAVLLFNNRRREEKLQAKRLSNRKSATILREKKKAFIQNMAKKNASLRKRVFILQNMPDLVIAINTKGIIKFCGSQVEQFLKHKIMDLLGANIEQIIVPKSRKTIQKLIKDTIATTAEQGMKDGDNKVMISNSSSDANHLSSRSSEKSFPMLEVNVDDMQTSTGDDVSDSSADRRNIDGNGRNRKHKSKGDCANTDSSSLTRQKFSFNEESAEPSAKKVKISAAYEKPGSEESYEGSSSDKADGPAKNQKHVKITSVATNNATQSSSMKCSTKSNKISKESERTQQSGIHKHQEHLSKESMFSVKAIETADRSLSSTAESSHSHNSKKTKKKSEYEADGTGYKESSSSSYGSSKTDSGEGKEKRRRLVPVYKVCFVRDDLTSVWCELTCSFCTRSSHDDDGSYDAKAALESIMNPRGIKNAESSGAVMSHADEEEEEDDEDELLICIRPTYEGKKVGKDCRFNPILKAMTGVSRTSSIKSVNSASASTDKTPSKPNNDESSNVTSPSKKQKTTFQQDITGEDDAQVVESLMLMSRKAP